MAGRVPSRPARAKARPGGARASRSPSSQAAPRARTTQLATKYLRAVLTGDRLKATDLLVRAVESGSVTAPDCYENILTPVQRELGKRWREGAASIVDERVALDSARMVMDRLYPRVRRTPAPKRTVVVACVQGNSHELGARMVADIFEASGWRAVFLGADVPAADIAAAAARFGARLVALSASTPEHVAATSDAVRALRAKSKARILVGGPAFTDATWHQTGADAHALSAQGAVEMGAKLTN